MKMKVFVPLIFAILLVGMIGYVEARVRPGTVTFTVPATQEFVSTILLDGGDKVAGSINVSGGSGNDIDFYVTDPNGNTILRYDRATQTSFSFAASITGTYTMHFDNSFSWFSSKSVTLNYSITKSILGLSPELFYFLVIILAIAIVAIVVAFALKRRKPAESPPVS